MRGRKRQPIAVEKPAAKAPRTPIPVELAIPERWAQAGERLAALDSARHMKLLAVAEELVAAHEGRPQTALHAAIFGDPDAELDARLSMRRRKRERLN